MTECRNAPSRLAGVVVRLVHDRRGAVAIEYGLLVAMIAVALVGIVSMSGVVDQQNGNFDILSDAMSPGP
jgi:Flp pilus assembly pilin Flp